MIVLRDVIDIEAGPQQAYDFLMHLEQNYRAWHPAHRSAEWITGLPRNHGSVLAVEEVLHGKLHRLKLRITSIRPNREIRYRLGPGLRGSFSFEPTADGLRFTAELALGWNVRGLGPVIDWICRHALAPRLRELQEHMGEEGQNLKRLLEANA